MSKSEALQQTLNAKLRADIDASLDAAIAEAERVGYVSADEADRRAEELLARLDANAAAGETKP